MQAEHTTVGSAASSHERSRKKLTQVLERTLNLDGLPVSVIYNNIVLDLVQHLARPAQPASSPSLGTPGQPAESEGERPRVADDLDSDLLSLATASVIGQAAREEVGHVVMEP